MSKQNNSVDYYSSRTAEITVSFPEDYIYCQYCDHLQYEYQFKKYRCPFTRELILYPFDSVGDDCPFAENKEKPVI